MVSHSGFSADHPRDFPRDPSDGGTAARLEGVQLAAREIGHRLGNHLALTVGALDLLEEVPDLPLAARELIAVALEGTGRAAADIRLFQRVDRLATKDTPAGPALDLERSAPASGALPLSD